MLSCKASVALGGLGLACCYQQGRHEARPEASDETHLLAGPQALNEEMRGRGSLCEGANMSNVDLRFLVSIDLTD